MAKKPHVIKLTRDDISLVTRGGNQALVDQITEELDHAEANHQVIFVRFSDEILQRVRVTEGALMEDPRLEPYLSSDEYWVEDANSYKDALAGDERMPGLVDGEYLVYCPYQSCLSSLLWTEAEYVDYKTSLDWEESRDWVVAQVEHGPHFSGPSHG